MEFVFRYYDSLNSTNEKAKEYITRYAKEGTVVVAKSQCAGKGTFGKSWKSPVGNLYFSLIIYPKKERHCYSELSFVVSVALHKTLSTLLPKTNIFIKSPNDIFIERKKTCGILIECFDKEAIIGVGINVNVAPTLMSSVYKTTCINKWTQTLIDADTVLMLFLNNFTPLYKNWHKKGIKEIYNYWKSKTDTSIKNR
ncbi:MAG: biotin--[acetyl-CoA-carboxylase] ligase [Alphaproteobacteria bacterium]